MAPARIVTGTFRDAAFTPGWVNVDRVVGLLETVGGQLEQGQGGSRFPLLWRLSVCCCDRGTTDEWRPEELSQVLQELDTVEKDLAAVPANVTPTFAFGEEGYAEVFSRESPRVSGSAQEKYRPIVDDIRQMVTTARDSGEGVSIAHAGEPVHWWR